MTNEHGETFGPIRQTRAADEIVHRIETLLLDGIFRDGDRLPGERDLAARLEVSRPVLRDALKTLETRGLVASRHGGGTYVADLLGEVFSGPMRALIARHRRATQDYLDYRREMEGLTADLAARRATPADRDRLTQIVLAMQEARRDGDQARGLQADVDFHTAIGESAHNIILLHTLRSCYRLLRDDIFFSRTTLFSAPGTADRLLEQHADIHAAILAEDPEAARRASQVHIDFVIEANRTAERSGEWARIAQMRLDQQAGG